jgi:hypothetical protein
LSTVPRGAVDVAGLDGVDGVAGAVVGVRNVGGGAMVVVGVDSDDVDAAGRTAAGVVPHAAMLTAAAAAKAVSVSPLVRVRMTRSSRFDVMPVGLSRFLRSWLGLPQLLPCHQ